MYIYALIYTRVKSVFACVRACVIYSSTSLSYTLRRVFSMHANIHRSQHPQNTPSTHLFPTGRRQSGNLYHRSPQRQQILFLRPLLVCSPHSSYAIPPPVLLPLLLLILAPMFLVAVQQRVQREQREQREHPYPTSSQPARLSAT